jgi:hypothetical protein
MASNTTSGICAVLVVAVLVYLIDPTFFGLIKSTQGFSGSQVPEPDEEEKSNYADMGASVSNGEAGTGMGNSGQANLANVTGNPNAALTQGFADLSSQEGPANFGSTATPAGCYPRDQLTPSELLPKDKNSVWAEQNPMGPGSLKGKNFLSAGALIGVNTVGQSLRNANWQLRSEPPNPQVAVSIFNQSTIAPDTNRRPLEIN